MRSVTDSFLTFNHGITVAPSMAVNVHVIVAGIVVTSDWIRMGQTK